MPKLNANLADVSTKFVPIDPGTYEMVIKKVTVQKSKNNKPQWLIETAVDDHGEFHGKTVREYITGSDEDAEQHKRALERLKRYAEAAVGEEKANDPDLDTDDLVGARFSGTIEIENYKDEKTDEERQSNRLKRVMAL